METYKFKALRIYPLVVEIVEETEYAAEFKRDESGIWWWCESKPRVVEGGEILESAYQIHKREEKLKRITGAHIL